MGNHIEMRNVAVVALGSGSAFSIEITNQSEKNNILYFGKFIYSAQTAQMHMREGYK